MAALQCAEAGDGAVGHACLSSGCSEGRVVHPLGFVAFTFGFHRFTLKLLPPPQALGRSGLLYCWVLRSLSKTLSPCDLSLLRFWRFLWHFRGVQLGWWQCKPWLRDVTRTKRKKNVKTE